MAVAPPVAVVEEPRSGVSPAVILGIVGGLVVLLAVMWFLFLRGGPATEETPAPAVTGAVPSPEPSPEPTPKKTKGPVETFEVFAPRDPFDPLIVADTGGGGGGGGTTVPGGEVPGGEVPGGEVPGGEAPGGDGSGDGDASVEGHRVRLIDVFIENGRERVQVQVDGVVFTVDEGEVFADNFQLIRVSDTCATFLFGDDQFTLCEGEEILK